MHRADALDTRPAGYVFATRDGGRPAKNNVRPRVFGAAVRRANANLERDRLVPLPEGLTPHKLRHTFASLLFALGKDPVDVMRQLGHTDPAFTLRVYAHAMRDGDEKQRLRALVDGSLGHGTGHAVVLAGEHDPSEPPDPAWEVARPAGFEPATTASGEHDG
jgi:integrase